MPNIRIETNVAKDKIDMKACLTELSKALASTTGKPEQHMVVQVIPDVAMMFGGSDEPCANAFFMCVGKMGPEENKVHGANLFPIITKYLGVPQDRLYILFRDAPRHEIVACMDILGK